MNNNSIPFVFFGTPDFAVTILDELKKNGLVPNLVVTTPDKPQGRKMILTPPPVKVWAENNGITVYQPEKLNDSSVAILQEKGQTLFVVAAYGKMIPKSILEIPKFGALNWHPSLLPKLRGASPIVSSILTETETGVTIMLIDEEMDHGPIIKQKEVISWKDDPNLIPTASDLEILLAKEGAKMLVEILPKHVSKRTTSKVQDHARATFTKKITKEDGQIDLQDDPVMNLRKIRAYNVWPRAYFFHELKDKKIRVIITKANIKENTLEIERVLPEGQKEMFYRDFIKRFSS